MKTQYCLVPVLQGLRDERRAQTFRSRPRDLTGGENALDDMSAGAGYHSTLHLHSLRTADLYYERSNLCLGERERV